MAIKINNIFLALALLSSGVATNQCLAEEPDLIGKDWMSDRFSVTIGGFFPDTETTIRVNSSDGTIGTQFNYEEQLELGNSDVSLDISMLWRIARKHSIEMEYFDIRRSGVTTLDVDIRFGDTIFKDQVEIDSFLDTRVVRVGYGYSFVHTPTLEFGLHLGVHVTDIATGISATSSGDDVSAREAIGTTAPLPVAGVNGAYRFADRWVVFGRAQYFQLEFDKYDGKMAQFAAGIEHDSFEHISLGLAYRYFDIQVDIDETDWTGEIDFRYNGPILYFRYGF